MNSKLKGIVVVVLLVAFSLVIWVFLQQKPEEGNVSITRVPDDAEVYINNKKVGDSVSLEVGKEYNIVGKKKGWKDYDQTINLTHDGENIIVILDPDSDEAREWLANNKEYRLSIEAASGENAYSYGKYEREANPILSYLSYKTAGYTITYGYKTPDDIKSFYLLIRASEGWRSAAIQKIYDLGFNAADYTIEFETKNSPFGDEL